MVSDDLLLLNVKNWNLDRRNKLHAIARFLAGIICGSIWGSFPVWGSFAVGDHLQRCKNLPKLRKWSKVDVPSGWSLKVILKYPLIPISGYVPLFPIPLDGADWKRKSLRKREGLWEISSQGDEASLWSSAHAIIFGHVEWITSYVQSQNGRNYVIFIVLLGLFFQARENIN